MSGLSRERSRRFRVVDRRDSWVEGAAGQAAPTRRKGWCSSRIDKEPGAPSCPAAAPFAAAMRRSVPKRELDAGHRMPVCGSGAGRSFS